MKALVLLPLLLAAPRADAQAPAAGQGAPVASLVPGKIPEGTAPAARALWEAVLANAAPGAAGRVQAFDLTFDVEARSETSLNNLGKVRYSFDADRRWLRSEWFKSGRIQLRGARGDWLVDKHKGDVIVTELIGRNNKESVREMDEWVSIAHNFLALANPGSVRLVSLREIDSPPVPLPRQLPALATGLRWLEAKSPDFRLYGSVRTKAAEPIFRALFGIRAKNGEVALAVLHEDEAATIVLESTLLVEIEKWTALQDYRVPHQLRVYEVDVEQSPWRFQERPAADLYLLPGGQLNPVFQPSYFDPPPSK